MAKNNLNSKLNFLISKNSQIDKLFVEYSVFNLITNSQLNKNLSSILKKYRELLKTVDILKPQVREVLKNIDLRKKNLYDQYIKVYNFAKELKQTLETRDNNDVIITVDLLIYPGTSDDQTSDIILNELDGINSNFVKNIVRYQKNKSGLDPLIKPISIKSKSQNHEEIAKKILDELKDFVKDGPPYISLISVSPIKTIPYTDDINIEDILMLGNPIKYDWADYINNKEDRCCVEEYFMTRFSKIFTAKKSTAKNHISLEKLRKITETNWQKGYSIKHVQKICENYQLRMSAYDINFDKILMYEPPKINPKCKKLTVSFVISDNHFYPISQKKRSVARIQKNAKNLNIKKNTLILQDTNIHEMEKLSGIFNPLFLTTKNKDIIRISEDKLLRFFEDNENISYIYFNGKVTGLRHDGKLYALDVDQNLKEDYKKMNIPEPMYPTPQNLGSALMPQLSTFLGKYNNIKLTPLRYQREKFCKSDINDKALDINLAYSKALNNDYLEISNLSEFILTDIYTKPGYYYGQLKGINNRDLGYRWIPILSNDSKVLNIVNNIKYAIIADRIIKKPFKNFLDTVENLKNKKSIINHSIGTLLSSHTKKYEIHRTRDRRQAMILFNKNYSIKKINDIYLIFKEKKTENMYSSKFIYDQIVFNNFLNLRKLAKNFKKITSIKTDSIQGILKPGIKMETWYKNDKLHDFQELYEFENCRDFEFQEFDQTLILEKHDIRHWLTILFDDNYDGYKNYTMSMSKKISYNEYMFERLLNIEKINKIMNTSSLIKGLAGSAKTSLLLNIEKRLISQNKTVVKLASNNIQAKLIKGYTIEKFVNFITKSKKTLKYDYILVDEYGLLDTKHLMRLSSMAKHSKAKLICFGDQNQCKPINLYQNYNKEFYNMFNAEYKLTTNYRNNLQDYSKIPTFKKSKIEDIKWHLCLSNKKRCEINLLMINKYKGTALTQKFIDRGGFIHIETKIAFYPELLLRCIANNSFCDIGDIYYYKKINLSQDEILRCFVPGYAKTIFSAQGLTIKNKYMIHELSKLTKESAYTAISRCVDSNNIYIPLI